MSDDIDQDPNEQASIESAAEQQEEHFSTQTIQLVEVVLGLRPYTLIEAKFVDPEGPNDDGLRLDGRYGGGADAGALPLLWLTSLPADQNPLTAAVKGLIDQEDGRDDLSAFVEPLAALASYVGFPMPESGK